MAAIASDTTPRLFVDTALSEGLSLRIDGAQAHYLLSVMRLREGAPVKLFDDRTGEWLAEIAAAGKRDAMLTIAAHLRDREAVPDLWLLAAPIRKGRIDWVAEKACELGVARLQPVLTRRTVVDRVNIDRLRAHMIEAAEQCGRTALPQVTEMTTLKALLAEWPAARTLYFADEEGGADFAPVPGPAAILIGPEGGFDGEERAAIRALPQAVAISLGPRILRADTAAVAAASLWMARAGDWF